MRIRRRRKVRKRRKKTNWKTWRRKINPQGSRIHHLNGMKLRIHPNEVILLEGVMIGGVTVLLESKTILQENMTILQDEETILPGGVMVLQEGRTYLQFVETPLARRNPPLADVIILRRQNVIVLRLHFQRKQNPRLTSGKTFRVRMFLMKNLNRSPVKVILFEIWKQLCFRTDDVNFPVVFIILVLGSVFGRLELPKPPKSGGI